VAIRGSLRPGRSSPPVKLLHIDFWVVLGFFECWVLVLTREGGIGSCPGPGRSCPCEKSFHIDSRWFVQELGLPQAWDRCRGPRVRSRGPGDRFRGPRDRSRGPRGSFRGLRNWSRGPRDRSRAPRTTPPKNCLILSAYRTRSSELLLGPPGLHYSGEHQSKPVLAARADGTGGKGPLIGPLCSDPQSPGPLPGDPGTGPGVPGTGPGDSGTSPRDPGSGPGDPGTIPGDPGTGPGDPGIGPEVPGTLCFSKVWTVTISVRLPA